eukprot:CAMPEP_0119301820 /NCGR_PEP_ID=MMETSP1333-20130426/3541_1 /TAXON_ID=418940 /ORGANISM="Scyphosphaera apsteinii, Strain RCC1455" /LENGTH=174 /DNA_ID=CAMNT_0007304007 /DNA_START=25 /DNA_END=546 /DNA_ORIENTATION=+
MWTSPHAAGFAKKVEVEIGGEWTVVNDEDFVQDVNEVYNRLQGKITMFPASVDPCIGPVELGFSSLPNGEYAIFIIQDGKRRDDMPLRFKQVRSDIVEGSTDGSGDGGGNSRGLKPLPYDIDDNYLPEDKSKPERDKRNCFEIVGIRDIPEGKEQLVVVWKDTRKEVVEATGVW